MKLLIKTIFIVWLTSLSLYSIVSLANDADLPVIQLNKFAQNLQTINATQGFANLLIGNPIYPDGADYAQQLTKHYEYLNNQLGNMFNFTQTQERKLAEHLYYYQYYSEHSQGGIIWEFEFGLRGNQWHMTKIYFAQH